VNSPSKGAYYGGAVAAPVFKEIADRVFAKHLEILQQKNYDKKSIATPYVKAANQKDIYTIYKKLDFATLSQNPEAEWVSVSSVSNKALMKKLQYRNGYVPDVTGMGLKDAVYLLENEGLKVQINGKGKVVKQSLTAGSKSKKGNIIAIDLARPSITADQLSEEIFSDSTNAKIVTADSSLPDTKNKTAKGKKNINKIKNSKTGKINIKAKQLNKKTPLKINKTINKQDSIKK
ncbi:MAG: PASTA domain-containing protein, partial [Bacteroidetes bacterium]|nr:PASTA domain-containing protein [Bacteroidota bacterium]